MQQEKHETIDQHRAHYDHAIEALTFIRTQMKVVSFNDIEPEKFVNLPDSKFKRVLILDMDETLIHCVDDIEKENPDVILEIDFPGEETACAGINLRPYLMECLREAAQLMQVIVFTASHQTYADAILDYIDPDGSLFSYRMYR